jgi:uncharacterized protein (DUF305 family)
MCLKKRRKPSPKQSSKLTVTDHILDRASEDRMFRIIALTLMLVASIAGIALAQSHHHDDANSGRTNSADSTFALQMMQAMDRMDSGMRAAKPTEDPDHDFATMMIPHHQGAIDMAKAELIYGRDPVLRRLAEGIIVEQQQEIELMQRSLNERSASHP